MSMSQKRKELSVVIGGVSLKKPEARSPLEQISREEFAGLSVMIAENATPRRRGPLEKTSSGLSESGERTPLAEISNKNYSDLSPVTIDNKLVGNSTGTFSPKTPRVSPTRSSSQNESTYRLMQSVLTVKPDDSVLMKTTPPPVMSAEKKSKFEPPMLGVVNVSPKPNSKNDFFDRYGISSDHEMYKGSYKLKGMRDGLYAWVKSKVEVTVKGQVFPVGTIFCRNKGGIDGGSDHRGLAKQINLEEDDRMTTSAFVEAGGVILIKGGKIEEWNCRTGRFSGPCNLRRKGVELEIGLPVEKYNPAGYEGTSPIAATGMVNRIFGSVAAFERASKQPAAKRLKKARPSAPLKDKDLSFRVTSEEISPPILSKTA